MVIYIAGKMTGLTDFGRAHFLAAQRALEQAGHVVLNPAVLPSGLPDESYLPITLAMLNEAEAVFLLDGWKESLGAYAEQCVARRQHKTLYYEDDKESCQELGIGAHHPESERFKKTCINCLYGDSECTNEKSPFYQQGIYINGYKPCKLWELYQ